MTTFQELGNSEFVSIESFRKNGLGVKTPVWMTVEGDALYCWTVVSTGKVKRIRNNPRVKLAKCDRRGNIEGDWIDATAEILEGSEAVKTQSGRMAKKYGLFFRMFQLVGGLRRIQNVVIQFREA